MLDTSPSGASRLIILATEGDGARPFVEGLTRGGIAVQMAPTPEVLMLSLSAEGADVVLVLSAQLAPAGTGGAMRLMRSVPRVLCVLVAAPGDGPEERAAALEAGAAEVLHGGIPLPEAIARIRAVLRRAPPRGADAGPWRLTSSGRRLVSPTNDTLKLTTAEFGLIALLATAAGEPVDREEVCRAVFRRPWRPDDRAVDSLVKRLRPKLPTDAIQSVRGVGYALTLPVRQAQRRV
ncbi:response regulator transcription factor [Roseomonas terrae]|jgi:DNA-binding response OmpR family regulator|uniref:Response regulator transcription factor n=1 Tax=Neoroseomonas terrae TaxID=424799 RepID=A0ABS5EQX7_9PROT|nr:winged helix-turn-helix domain-containing protein [Neoroseomonas terrae]MBR0653421.1 response regulator transcription factor [Neoroseomonas terrae]